MVYRSEKYDTPYNEAHVAFHKRGFEIYMREFTSRPMLVLKPSDLVVVVFSSCFNRGGDQVKGDRDKPLSLATLTS